MTDKQTKYWHARAEATKQLNWFREIANGCQPYEIMGSSARKSVTNVMSSESFAKQVLGMRQKSMRRTWKRLVKLAADKPRALGFAQVEEGLRGLEYDLGVDKGTLSRNLRAWEERDDKLIVVQRQESKSGRNPIVGVHIPLLTEWLLWVAEAHVYLRTGTRDIADYQMVRAMPKQFLPELSPPPGLPLTKAQALSILGPDFERTYAPQVYQPLPFFTEKEQKHIRLEQEAWEERFLLAEDTSMQI